MRHRCAAAISATLLILAACGERPADGPPSVQPAAAAPTAQAGATTATAPRASSDQAPAVDPAPLTPWQAKGVAWLIAAQHPEGGWGAGSHGQQGVRDPHAVVVDPATTAFVALALMRIGTTPDRGEHRAALAKALGWLADTVERAPLEGPRVTELAGTQIQAKLGPLIDTALAAECLARALPVIAKADPLHARIDAALDKCLRKLEASQDANGHWGGGGWAPVLQSSTATTALELAQAAGKKVDPAALERARRFQRDGGAAVPGDSGGRVDAVAAVGAVGGTAGAPVRRAPGAAPTEAAAMSAGVELYAFSGSQRANASQALQAEEAIREAKEERRLDQDAKVDEESLALALGSKGQARQLYKGYADSREQAKRVVSDDKLLDGFGNNGGEEYLSYMRTSESLVIGGGEALDTWMAKMEERLPKAQNPDGSWSGHHCISSPVFCTAAVLQCATARNDERLLKHAAVAMADPAPAPKPAP